MSENRNGSGVSAADERAREAALRRLVPEVRTALNNAPDVRAWPPSWHDDEWVDYFYHSSTLLTRDRDLSRVQDALRDLGAWRDEGGDSLISGVTRLDVNVRESQHTPDLIEDLDNRLGIGVATLDHAFIITGLLNCPATEPEPVITPAAANDPVVVRDALWPGMGDPSAGRDVAVSVVDTGLLSGASAWAPWIEGVRPDTSADIEDPDQIKINAIEHEIVGFADPYAGHGTFVSGVIRCVAPASTVVVERILGVSGFARESRLIQQIHDALDTLTRHHQHVRRLLHQEERTPPRLSGPLGRAFEPTRRHRPRGRRGQPVGDHSLLAGRIPVVCGRRLDDSRRAASLMVQQPRGVGRRLRAGRGNRQRLRPYEVQDDRGR